MAPGSTHQSVTAFSFCSDFGIVKLQEVHSLLSKQLSAIRTTEADGEQRRQTRISYR